MKPSLQLNIGQQLTLTPQLQQAIRLLQLSTLDLQQEIQMAVETNPMLEASQNEEPEESSSDVRSVLDEYSDYQWSELYRVGKNSLNMDDGEYGLEQRHATTTTLREHLLWQMNLSPMSHEDKIIAATIIDAINDDGFLTMTCEDMQDSLKKDLPSLTKAEFEAVRHLVQRFDPLGCACVNLQECLLVQLNADDTLDEIKALATAIVKNHLEWLAQRQFKQLIRFYKITEQDIQKVILLIQQLDARPGSRIEQNNTEYVIPDVIVQKSAHGWDVQLNQYALPKLSINQQYASLIKRNNNSSDNLFLKNNLQEARWFLKSIQSRQETLLRVATAIMSHQKDFLELGDEAMKPLILNEIAGSLGLHESTISRVTTQKYIHTPRGVYELKYFFSSQLNTDDGTSTSSTAIRAMLKKLIAEENRQKPLSDNKIVALMAKQGVQIARRTVAKYREALGIAPSHERKEIRC